MPTERAQEKNVVLCPNVFSHCREALNILCRSCSIVYLEKKKKKNRWNHAVESLGCQKTNFCIFNDSLYASGKLQACNVSLYTFCRICSYIHCGFHLCWIGYQIRSWEGIGPLI